MLPTMKRVETNPGVVNPGKEVFKIEAGRQVQMSFVVASGIKFDRLEQAPSNTLVLSMASEAPLGENQTGCDLRIAIGLLSYHPIVLVFGNRFQFDCVPNRRRSNSTVFGRPSGSSFMVSHLRRSTPAPCGLISSLSVKNIPARSSSEIFIISPDKRVTKYCVLGNQGTAALVSGVMISGICLK